MPYHAEITRLKAELARLNHVAKDLNAYSNDIEDENSKFIKHDYSKNKFKGQKYDEYRQMIEEISSKISSTTDTTHAKNSELISNMITAISLDITALEARQARHRSSK